VGRAPCCTRTRREATRVAAISANPSAILLSPPYTPSRRASSPSHACMASQLSFSGHAQTPFITSRWRFVSAIAVMERCNGTRTVSTAAGERHLCSVPFRCSASAAFPSACLAVLALRQRKAGDWRRWWARRALPHVLASACKHPLPALRDTILGCSAAWGASACATRRLPANACWNATCAAAPSLATAFLSMQTRSLLVHFVCTTYLPSSFIGAPSSPLYAVCRLLLAHCCLKGRGAENAKGAYALVSSGAGHATNTSARLLPFSSCLSVRHASFWGRTA